MGLGPAVNTFVPIGDRQRPKEGPFRQSEGLAVPKRTLSTDRWPVSPTVGPLRLSEGPFNTKMGSSGTLSLKEGPFRPDLGPSQAGR